jgi:hypothetical protein
MIEHCTVTKVPVIAVDAGAAKVTAENVRPPMRVKNFFILASPIV